MRRPVEDLGKLPKWAQRKINALEMHLAEAQNVVKSLSSSTEPTDTRIMRPPFDDAINLPNNSQIEFKPKKGKAISAYLRYDTDKELTVTCDSGSLRVMPWATNSVRIYVEN